MPAASGKSAFIRLREPKGFLFCFCIVTQMDKLGVATVGKIEKNKILRVWFGDTVSPAKFGSRRKCRVKGISYTPISNMEWWKYPKG